MFDSLTDIQLDPKTDISQIKKGYVDGVYDILSASPRFKKVVLSDSGYNKLLAYGNLTWIDVDKICHHDTTDALLYLWKAVSYDALTQVYSNAWHIEDYERSIILNRTNWVFFQPDAHQQMAGFVYNDTVIIGPNMMNLDEEYLLYQNCYVMGQAFGKKICPYWSDGNERILFTGPGRELKRAAGLTAQDQWPQAGVIWNELADSPHKNLASRAAFNLALAYERDDVLDQAVLWISYADSLLSTPATIAYKRILNDRIKIKPTLDQQIAGN